MPQFPLIRDAVKAFSVPCFEEDGFEADDIIASYALAAKAAGFRALVLTAKHHDGFCLWPTATTPPPWRRPPSPAAAKPARASM